MAQIEGKYEIVENKNYYEFLLKLGVPEPMAKLGNEMKSTLEIQIDGKKIRLISDADTPQKNVTELILDQEVAERTSSGSELKSTVKIKDSVLTIDSNLPDGTPAGKRLYTASDTGVELKAIPTRTDIPEATRIYKRI